MCTPSHSSRLAAKWRASWQDSRDSRLRNSLFDVCCRRTPNKPNCGPTLVDASPGTETLGSVERWTRIETRCTFQSRWALETALEPHLEDGLDLCHLLLTRFEPRTAPRKALCPIPSTPRYLFDIGCEDGRNRNRRIRCDGGGCSRLEPVPEPGHGDDDAISKIIIIIII